MIWFLFAVVPYTYYLYAVAVAFCSALFFCMQNFIWMCQMVVRHVKNTQKNEKQNREAKKIESNADEKKTHTQKQSTTVFQLNPLCVCNVYEYIFTDRHTFLSVFGMQIRVSRCTRKKTEKMLLLVAMNRPYCCRLSSPILLPVCRYLAKIAHSGLFYL